MRAVWSLSAILGKHMWFTYFFVCHLNCRLSEEEHTRIKNENNFNLYRLNCNFPLHLLCRTLLCSPVAPSLCVSSGRCLVVSSVCSVAPSLCCSVAHSLPSPHCWSALRLRPDVARVPVSRTPSAFLFRPCSCVACVTCVACVASATRVARVHVSSGSPRLHSCFSMFLLAPCRPNRLKALGIKPERKSWGQNLMRKVGFGPKFQNFELESKGKTFWGQDRT